jgi:hypothetical protein
MYSYNLTRVFRYSFFKVLCFRSGWLLPSLAFLAVSGELESVLGVGRSTGLASYPLNRLHRATSVVAKGFAKA